LKRNLKSSDTLKIQVKESFHIKSKTYFSIQHIQSAALFTRNAHKIEKEHDGIFNNDKTIEHRAFVTSAIITSVSCLEASINELFTDIHEGEHIKSNKSYEKLEEQVILAMAESWEQGVPRRAKYPIIKKYEVAMELSKVQSFKNELFYKDAWLLTKLRNSLIHYEPEWVDSHSNEYYEEHEYEKLLKGKFETNPLTGIGNPFFPDKSLSHGCAEWAVQTVVTFIESFSDRLNILPSFHHVKDKLKTQIIE
jgi:hypothetical protein